MPARIILLVIVGSLTAAPPGYSQASANNQNVPQTPSEVARFLVDQGAVVQVPVKGKVNHSIKKEAPTFAMPQGATSTVLLRLPEYQSPYVMTITSYKKGFGRTTEIFIPSGFYFDSAFQQLGEFGEERLAGKVESLAAEFDFDDTSRNARYLLLYTRGDLVGQRLGMRGDLLGRVSSGLFRLERSLEAKLQVETKPETEPQ